MTHSDQEPTEDSVALVAHEKTDSAEHKKRRQALAKVGRTLSDDDLKSPGVQKMLLDNIDRLEMEVDELSGFRERFHTAHEDAAVLRERLYLSWVRDGSLASGAAILGLAQSLWSVPLAGWIVTGIGGLLLVVAFVAKGYRS